MAGARVFSLAIATAVLAALTACGGGPTGSPNPAPNPSGTEDLGTVTASPTTAQTTTNPPAPAYPNTARAYAEAVLAAWGQKQNTRLMDLTTAQVHEQIIEIPGPPNQQWGYVKCDGAAGSSYCSFVNADGDVITLRIVNQFLGGPHAATEVKLDQTEYLSNAKDYVKAFVEAWRNGNTKRMLALSSQAEVDFFTHYAPPDTYQICSFHVAPVWQVRFHNAAGLDYIAKVSDSLLGKKHAITSHLFPVPLPPVCA